MERKRSISSANVQEERSTSNVAEVISVAQIRELVRLLDRSDVAELEFKRPVEGIHLVLRKVKAGDGTALTDEVEVLSEGTAGTSATRSDAAHIHNVVSPLVGLFHPWLKPRGAALVNVGDLVKVGQLVGTVESLNVFNEVEATVAGRVSEIFAQDGQPVEYGQVLLTIDSSEAEGA